MGYEDALDMHNHSKTVRCNSIMAEVYAIPSNEFIQKMNVYQDTLRFMKERAKNLSEYTSNQGKLNKEIIKVNLQ